MTIESLFQRKGAPVIIHREGDLIPCPCRTPEGYRDPAWHKAHPEQPECNPEGFLDDPIEYKVKAFVQPIGFAGRTMGSRAGFATQPFGEIKSDDHIGMFPLTTPADVPLDFSNWTDTGADYIEYNGMRFVVISWSLIPNPHDASLNHHWELMLRRIQATEYGPAIGY